MDSKLARICDGLIEAGWLAAVIATPLFFNIHSARVFEPDKLTLLRSIAVLMAAAWLVKFVTQKGWQDLGWLRPRGERSVWRMPFVLPVALLVVVYLVSTVFSITPVVSWAGSYQRLQGTYTTLAYIVVFSLMIATIRSREQVSRVVTAVIISSIPVSLYAMLQHFGLDPLPWGGNVQARVAANMGNSIFVAAYLIMVVPLTLARIVDGFTNILNDEELSAADVVRSSIYIFALAIQLIAIYWSRSRGPFLGIAVGLYAFILITLVTLRDAGQPGERLKPADIGRAILLVAVGTVLPLLIAALVLEGRTTPFAAFAFFVAAIGLLVVVIFVMAVARRGWRWLWLSWILLAVTLAGFLGLFNVSHTLAESTAGAPVVGETLGALASWRELPEIGRFGQLLESGSGSGRVRVLIWEGVLDLIQPHDPLQTPDGQPDRFNFLRPALGYGPESMYVAYNRFYRPELATIEARNASPDRSHNETFDALAITGVAGLLAWQFLYLSVFYFGFRWLGVVRTRRDRNVLIGLWIGGAILGGLVITVWLGLAFLGVALPFGSIAGLVVYLIYYALSTRGAADEEGTKVDPFSRDRLLLIGLVAAVLAHYVEINFGIAIAATRTHFFVFVALMFMVGYYLPRTQEEPEVSEPERKTGRKRRRSRVRSNQTPGWIGPVLASAFMLGLIVTILGYDYLAYSVPPDVQISSVADLPTAADVFHQSMFVNPKNGFVDSPFIFLLVTLSWVLGSLIILSELSKSDQIGLGAAIDKIDPGRLRLAGILFIIMLVLAAAGQFLILGPGSVGLNSFLGALVGLLWGAVSLWTGFRLLTRRSSARQMGGIVALVGLILAVPVAVAGAVLEAAALAVFSGAILYLLWDASWKEFILPAATVAFISIGVGLLYAYLHAAEIRAGFLPPPGVTSTTPAVQQRVLETDQTAGLLSTFYLYFFIVVVAMGVSFAQPKLSRAADWGTALGYAAAVAIVPLVVLAVTITNVRVIQADMVYKRGDPWDKEASRTSSPEMWDNAIAIYEHAIDLAPTEDFYYLWLGRAYLERSSVTEDRAEQEALLTRAETQLKRAQEINPLNTDHTANLARLSTRWAEFSEDGERQQLVTEAADYYERAISLSPNNAVIINEYARLAYLLQNDCQKALELYDQSTATDPFFADTFFEEAEVASNCAAQADAGEQEAYYETAVNSLTRGLDREPGDLRRWLQLAELQIRLNHPDQALAAYDEAVARADENVQVWQIDFTMAQWFSTYGDAGRAREFAQQALDGAPPEAVAQIQQLLDQLAPETSSGG